MGGRGKRGNCWLGGEIQSVYNSCNVRIILASERLLFEKTPEAGEAGLLALMSESSSPELRVGLLGGGISLSSSTPTPGPDIPHPHLGRPLPVCSPSCAESSKLAKDPADQETIPKIS